MDKDLSKEARPGARTARWNDGRTTYLCANGIDVVTLHAIPKREYGVSGIYSKTTYASGIRYKAHEEENRTHLFVSGAEFSRSMSQIVWGARNAKTVAFPNTVKEVQEYTFFYTTIRSAVLNEGLETLGEYRNEYYHGVFFAT